jgi:hypothetical protein
MIIVVLCSICAILLFAACEGVSGGATTISGKILSVNSTAHSVTVQGSVNGQQQTLTISGLTDQQIATLKGQTGNYNFQVIPNGTSYTISSDSQPISQSEATPEGVTPEATTTGTTSIGNVQGNVSFIGRVQSINGTNLVVLMPNGNPLSMTIGNNGDNNQIPSVGQQVKIKANTNTDGSFQTSEIKNLDNEQNNDLNTMSFTGITTSIVGTDNMLHFKVGSQNFSALIDNNTKLKHVNNNSAQTIGSNQNVKVDVRFNGGNGNALEVELGND